MRTVYAKEAQLKDLTFAILVWYKFPFAGGVPCIQGVSVKQSLGAYILFLESVYIRFFSRIGGLEIVLDTPRVRRSPMELLLQSIYLFCYIYSRLSQELE